MPDAQPFLTIACNGLGKRFNREWIFRHLDYTFSTGKTYAIVGPNGSGKSTLLSILSAQTPPTTGKPQFFLDGKEIEAEQIFRHLSIAAPYLDLIDEFTLQEQLEFHFNLREPDKDISIAELLEIMYLKEAKDKFIGNFSSGMKQRVKLALAFYTKGNMILLDEPGTNLDKKAFAWYLEQFKKVNRSKLILVASNNPDEYPSHDAEINILDYKKA